MKYPTQLSKQALRALALIVIQVMAVSCTNSANVRRSPDAGPSAATQEPARPSESKSVTGCANPINCVANSEQVPNEQASTIVSSEDIKRKLSTPPQEVKPAEEQLQTAATEGENTSEYSTSMGKTRSLEVIAMAEEAPKNPKPKPAVKPRPKIRQVLKPKVGDALANQPSLDLRINFEFNSAILTPDGKQQAQELGKALVQILDEDKQAKFVLLGHTDIFGSEQYNINLSKDRAESVKSYLTENFPPLGTTLRTEGMGKRHVLSGSSDEESQKLNRRVEVKRLH
jgi:outer membrane protein OmpA-like peptidoglycan-associated protein